MKPTADELLERYADAAAQDASRPSAPVREAVRAHAAMLAKARASNPNQTPIKEIPPAANQSRWAIPMLASLAIVGLSTLLMLQIDRGTAPGNEDLALGASMQTENAPVTTAPPAAKAPSPAGAAAAAPRAVQVPEPGQTRSRESTARLDERHARVLSQATPQAKVTAETVPPAAAPAPMADSVASLTLHKAGASADTQAPIVPAPARAALARANDPQAGSSVMQFMEAIRRGQVSTVEALVQQGQSVNTRDEKGNTALMLAVTHRQAAVAEKLLALGADTTLANHDGLRALELARRLDLHDMIQLLQTRR